LSEEFLDKVQRVQTGQAIVLRIDGVDRRFQVVGIVSSHLGGTRIYTSYESFTTWKGVPGQTNWVLVRVSPSVLQSGEAQSRLAARLQEHFKTAGLNVGDTETQYEEVVSNTSNFDILLSVLLLMAGLLALVGGMGLGGAMSLNILERTREIGVLRAVGASNASVRKIVLFEGIVIGLVSWLLSVLASIPVGWLLTDTVGQALLHTTVGYHISTLGIGLWLALIQFIAALSSLAPAQHAARLTVREVLAYE
jgi:putative ABC transport system permease protein